MNHLDCDKSATTNNIASNIANRKFVYIFWFILSLFYLLQYISRVLPNIFSNSLFADFGMTYSSFASLSSIYFFSYGFAQIPYGICADRFGIFFVVIFGILSFACGSILWSCANSILELQFSRMLLGLGSAGAFLPAIKLINDHLPSKIQGIFMGITLSIGMIGPLFAVDFFKYFSTSTSGDGNGSMNIYPLNIATIGIFSMILVVCILNNYYKKNINDDKDTKIKDVKTSKETHSSIKELNDLKINKAERRKKNICSNIPIKSLICAVLTIGCYAPLGILSDAWGSLFLQSKFNISQLQATRIALLPYFGMAMGSIIIPIFANNCIKMYRFIVASLISIFILFFILIYHQLPLSIAQIILFSIGFLCGGEMLCFALATYKMNSDQNGMTIGILNTINMIGCAFLQQLIGGIIDLQNLSRNLNCDPSTQRDEISTSLTQFHSSIADIYPSFQVAMSAILVIIAVCICLCFLLKREIKNF